MEEVKVRNKRFINNYENKIKQYRKEYYRNIIKHNSEKSIKFPHTAFALIPTFIAIILIIKDNFSIMSYITAFLSIIILNFLIKILKAIFKVNDTTDYIREIRKLGYFSVESYEKSLKKYVTGPGGYYDTILKSYLKEYNLNENSRKIQGIHGESYFIWSNQNQDRINFLNCQGSDKPEIKSIRLSNIRYYRVDNERRMIILKTDVEDFYLTLSSLEVLNVLMKQKRYENISSFSPETHINDFELYMHKVKNDLTQTPKYSTNSNSDKITKIITSIIIISVIIAVSFIVEEYRNILGIITLFFIPIINSNIGKLFISKNIKLKDDDDYIIYLNRNNECIDRFEELKFALGISNTYDKVYTNEGACYLTWVANGYFHVFLNVIYFNVVYMAINTNDVMYYRVNKNECIVKTKDKELIFAKEASKVFAKILPNKDYEWLKGYQNKNNML